MEKCGTTAGYYAHYKADRKVECRPCLDAMAEAKAEERRTRAAQAAASFEEAIHNEPVVEDDLDELQDLRDNLRIVRAAMRVSKSTRDTSTLSKQRADLVAKIKEIETRRASESGEKVSALDQLAARRASRRATATG